MYLMNAIEWARATNGITPPSDFYCETRDAAQARIEKLRTTLIQAGWSEDVAGLLFAIVGELAGNCFDHNLGKWKDVPGCWLEIKSTEAGVRAIVADRGQGVLTTLRQVVPHLTDASEALRIAFTETITGRAPEQRGNGLKFVLRSLKQFSLVESFLFISGSAKLEFHGAVDIPDIPRYIGKTDQTIAGTHAEMLIRK